MRPTGIHPTAVIGEPPEHRDWHVGDPIFPPEIHPSARVNALVTVDSGHKRPTKVGARTFLMAKAHVAHDAIVGDDCELASLVTLGGWVEIGDRVKVGLGAVIKPRVIIGDGAVIGCGAVVIRDVPAGETWVGNPAKPIGQATLSEWEEWWELSRR